MNRTYLTIIFLSLLISCATEPIENTDDSKSKTSDSSKGIKKEEVGDIKPYSEQYPSGTIKIKGQKINDKKTGKWISYYEDGKLWSEVIYYKGEKNGKTTSYFNNGMLRYKGAYVNDLKQGSWHYYDQNGKVVKSVKFHRNELVEKK